MNAGARRRSGWGVRALVIGLGLTQVLILIAFITLMLQSTDPLGRSIGRGMAGLATLLLASVVLPALALGLRNRALATALVLELVAIAAAALFWQLA